MTTYLDANATQPLRPVAAKAMLDAAQYIGNPSSTHQQGRKARACLEAAREDIAYHLGGYAINCIFTSGGTEANALAMHGLGEERHFFVGTTEHNAVLENIPSHATATYLDVLPSGQIDLNKLEDGLKKHAGRAFICLMGANNETGVIHPLKEIGELSRRYGAHFHCDGVQYVGHIPLSIDQLGIDSLACSGHKLGGPKGAGALLLSKPYPQRVKPLYGGGGQEMGRRSGTPPLPAIAGFAAALRESLQKKEDFSRLRDHIEMSVRPLGVTICGEGAPRLSHTSCLAMEGFSSQSQLMQLDLGGFCISSGPACSSGTMRPSHVLKAMGYDSLAGEAIRVSLPWTIQDEEVEAFIDAYRAMVERFKASRRGQ